MDAKNKMNRINIMLATALLLLIACLSAMVYSYVKLQQAYPLENLRGAITQPVYGGDPGVGLKRAREEKGGRKGR